MDAEQLRAQQAPLKQQYRDEPERARLTLRASGRVGEGITCSIDSGRRMIEAGLHPATGGSGAELCSGDLLLEALVACAGVTIGAVATALGIELREATLEAEGDLDFRGTLGVAKDVPVGFSAIRLRLKLDTDASAEQVASLLRLSERYCVVFQTLAHPPSVQLILDEREHPGTLPP